jgi:hypothetical protein
MLTFSIIIAVLVVGGYFLRKNFRRSFYVLWTGDENPDWDALEQKWYGEEGEQRKESK